MLLLLLLLLLQPQNNDSANDSCGIEVKFSSKNFKNILTWSTPRNEEDVRYNVMYSIYGIDAWSVKAECTNITQNWCDLSNETTDRREQYYGKVVINNQDCKLSERFDPLDTILDPPNVRLFLTGTSLTINLTHVVENLSGIYDGLQYEINVSEKLYKTENSYYTIENIDLQRKHCVSAKLSWFRSATTFSNKTCIGAKADQTPEERGKIMLYILGVILVLFTVSGVGYGVHKYVHVGNLQQPQILNLTSNNNNNLVFVDAHNITINVITIESGKSNEQSTMMAEKNDKTQVKEDFYFTNDGYDVSHSSGVPEDEDIGYISLLEQVPATRPHVSPYDMPHNILETPAKPSMASSLIINKEGDQYGRIKCNKTITSIQEKNTVEAFQKAERSEETFTYLPKNDQHIPRLDVLNYKPREDSSEEQDADTTDVKDGTDYSECGTLFIDWSPTSHHLYIPNVCNKTIKEVGTEECQEGLLSNLYKPIETEDSSEELACLEQRWELHVNMVE
ncbi:interleukin-20 receptor subunit alpha-like [Hyla sarda]|uniref:interleukin-20 receptor subunit alpha-like n=1 Tax=Hyla sarda TaxID=327740 RepID=UPI0024C29515|nr:interleukin-20 receptor subunit alpha-like [Hyla sarda]XP_056419301.1 interleukin-20 receptor subunit alpha-like [Hyla sarda]